MFLIHSRWPVLIFVVLLLLRAACQTSSGSELGPPPTVPPSQAAIATPDPRLATPPSILPEDPLGSDAPAIPDSLVLDASRSKKVLAAYLKTTPSVLDWVNPNLPDPVPAGTFVTIPDIYRTVQGETFADIARKTGLPENLLRAANPAVDAQTPFATVMNLKVPRLYIVAENMPLSEVAATLQTSVEMLSAVNPALAGQAQVPAAMVVVVPLTK